MSEMSYEERAREEKAPLQWKSYKGMKGKFGAMRLNLKKAWTSGDIRKAEGVVFLEMAPTIGPNNYDWQNQKMIMALGITDIPKVILYLRNPSHVIFKDRNDPSKKQLLIYHDKGAGTNTKGQNVKTLQVVKPDDAYSFFFTMYQKEGTKETTATVPISPDEAIAIGTLLQAAITQVLAW